MNQIYIVLIFSILFSTFLTRKSNSFFLKQYSFGNHKRINNRKHLSIKEIEDNLLQFNTTYLSSPVTQQLFLFYERPSGIDMHITEDIEFEEELMEKIVKNNKRMEILQLLESSVSIDEKIDMLNKYPGFFQDPGFFQGQRNGGLMKKWLDDELFDDISE